MGRELGVCVPFLGELSPHLSAKFAVLEQTNGLRLLAKFCLDRFIQSPSGATTPKFCRFLDFGICGVASSEKVEHGAQLQTCIKTISILQQFHGEIVRRNSVVQKRDGHTKKQTELEYGQMPNVMAAQPNIGGAVCENSAIPFLVRRHKVWLTAAVRVPCSNSPNLEERETWTQSEFCSCQNSVRGNYNPQNVYIVYQCRRRPNTVQSLVDLR